MSRRQASFALIVIGCLGVGATNDAMARKVEGVRVRRNYLSYLTSSKRVKIDFAVNGEADVAKQVQREFPRAKLTSLGFGSGIRVRAKGSHREVRAIEKRIKQLVHEKNLEWEAFVKRNR